VWTGDCADAAIRAVFAALTLASFPSLTLTSRTRPKADPMTDQPNPSQSPFDPANTAASTEPQSPVGPDPEFDDEFTAHLRGMTEDPGRAMTAYWKAVFDLDEWHFIRQPAQPGEPAPPPDAFQPVGARIEDKMFILAFTNEDRANACARQNNIEQPDGAAAIITLPRTEAAETLCRIESDQVDGVMFNSNRGEAGMYAPLHNIAAMYDHYHNALPAGCINAMAKAVQVQDKPEAWARLHQRVGDLEQWFFIADTNQPGLPRFAQVDDQVMVLIFTDQQRAAKGAAAAGGTDEAGKVPLIPVPPAKAAEAVSQIAEQSQGKLENAIFNAGSDAFIVDIGTLQRIAPSA
jgi:hypothetical protein